MKKYITIALLLLVTIATYAYFPLLKNDKQWNIESEQCFAEHGINTYEMSPLTYRVSGDTLFNDINYKILRYGYPFILGFMREEDFTTYIYFPLPEYLLDNEWAKDICIGCEIEFVFCKFDVNIGDTIKDVYVGNFASDAGRTCIVDSIQIDIEGRRKIFLHMENEAHDEGLRSKQLIWLEGVGPLYGRIWFMPPPDFVGAWEFWVNAQVFCVHDILEDGTEEMVYQSAVAKELGCKVNITTPIEEAEICAPYITDGLDNTLWTEIRLVNTAGGVAVQSSATDEFTSVDIHLMDGTRVEHTQVLPNGKEGFIPLSLPNGIYLFRIYTTMGKTIDIRHILNVY